MRLAVISDIEGNDQAVEQVLGQTEGCEHVVCLGDIVGNKGDSDRVIQLLKDRQALSIFGNHDLELVLQQDVAASESLAKILYDGGNTPFHTDIVINDESRQYLEQLDLRMTAEHDGMTLGFIHSMYGHYRDRLYFDYVSTTNALQVFDQIAGDLVFVGHKHIPAVFKLNGDKVHFERITRSTIIPIDPSVKMIINVGSLGASRDDSIACSYATVDFEQGRVDAIVTNT